MNSKTLSLKDKLQKIAAIIGKLEIEEQNARLSGNYEVYKLKRGAAQMARAEFSRLSKIYRKAVKQYVDLSNIV